MYIFLIKVPVVAAVGKETRLGWDEHLSLGSWWIEDYKHQCRRDRSTNSICQCLAERAQYLVASSSSGAECSVFHSALWGMLCWWLPVRSIAAGQALCRLLGCRAAGWLGSCLQCAGNFKLGGDFFFPSLIRTTLATMTSAGWFAYFTEKKSPIEILPLPETCLQIHTYLFLTFPPHSFSSDT